jgi:hypothetical protein
VSVIFLRISWLAMLWLPVLVVSFCFIRLILASFLDCFSLFFLFCVFWRKLIQPFFGFLGMMEILNFFEDFFEDFFPLIERSFSLNFHFVEDFFLTWLFCCDFLFLSNGFGFFG